MIGNKTHLNGIKPAYYSQAITERRYFPNNYCSNLKTNKNLQMFNNSASYISKENLLWNNRSNTEQRDSSIDQIANRSRFHGFRDINALTPYKPKTPKHINIEQNYVNIENLRDPLTQTHVECSFVSRLPEPNKNVVNNKSFTLLNIDFKSLSESEMLSSHEQLNNELSFPDVIVHSKPEMSLPRKILKHSTKTSKKTVHFEELQKMENNENIISINNPVSVINFPIKSVSSSSILEDNCLKKSYLLNILDGIVSNDAEDVNQIKNKKGFFSVIKCIQNTSNS